MTVEQQIADDIETMRSKLLQIEQLAQLPHRDKQQRSQMLITFGDVRDLVITLSSKLTFELK